MCANASDPAGSLKPRPYVGTNSRSDRLERSTNVSFGFLLIAAIICAAQCKAQTPPAVAHRITSAIDEAALTKLSGNTHPLARPEFDQGAVADSLPLRRMLLLLKR